MKLFNLAIRGRANVPLATGKEAGINLYSPTLSITTELKKSIGTAKPHAIKENNIGMVEEGKQETQREALGQKNYESSMEDKLANGP